MILLQSMFLGIVKVIEVLIEIEIFAILLRAILSWFPHLRIPWLFRLLWVLTEPLLAPIRRAIPPWRTAGLDLSPLIAIFLLWAFKVVIIYPVKISLIYGGGP